MKRLLNLISLLCLFFYIGHAQQSPKKHTVSYGETLLSISKKYKITPYDLQKANPGAIEGVKENDVLIIPEQQPASTHLTDTSKITNSSGASHSISYTVKSGDTKFSLAKRYGLTVSELESQNPEISSGLEVGQVLAIHPGTIPPSQKNTASASHPRAGKTHVVRKGETLFGISSANGLQVSQLIEANSRTIIGNNLMEGQVIWIPGTDAADSDDYVVQKGDTKFSLAKRYNTSIKNLERHNPHIIEMLQIGQTINMPNKANSKPTAPVALTQKNASGQATKTIQNTNSAGDLTETVSTTDHQNTTALETTNTPEPPSKESPTSLMEATTAVPTETPLPGRHNSGYYDLRTSASTPEPKKLLFFLPFSEKEFQAITTSKNNFNSVSDNFKRNHLEFYKGARLAIDSLRKLNLQVAVTIIEAQSTNQTSKTKLALKENNINDYDAAILPFYKTPDESIVNFTANSKVPIITASAISTTNHMDNLYSASPSKNLQRLEVLNYMKGKKAHIIVLNDANQVENRTFIAEHAPAADIVEIKKNGAFSEKELISKLKAGQHNFIVIDSERNSVFLNATTALLGQLSHYSIQLAVLEASLIPDDTDVSQKRYRILKMVFPSLIPAKSTANSRQFLSTYQKQYNTLPTANIMLGFDITFDSLLRLMQQQSFEHSIQNYITEYTQLKFNYKKNNLGGYSNEGIYILQYDSDAQIREAN